MNNKYSISLIGSGNLATNLALAFARSGHQILEIYSRKKDNAAILSKQLSGSTVSNSMDLSNSRSSIFIISVSDNMIPDVVSKLVVPDGSIVVHTSGTSPLNVLDGLKADAKPGVFYPLQTFRKTHQVDFFQIPILYESLDNQTNTILNNLGKSVSSSVRFLDGEDRMTVHLAAVFSSNFINRMLKASEEVLSTKGLPLELLKPLAMRSIENCFNTTPNEALTGPARRKDVETIDKHLEILSSKPVLKDLYQRISDEILSSGIS